MNGSTHLTTKYDPRRSRQLDDGMATNERMQNESSIRTNNIAKKRKQWYAHIVHPMPFLVVPLYDTMSARMNQSSARLSDRTKTSRRPRTLAQCTASAHQDSAPHNTPRHRGLENILGETLDTALTITALH